MTILSKQVRALARARGRLRAFTLVELMFTLSLLAIVMAAMIPTFLVFSKHSVSLGNYVDMSADSRAALEMLARDVRSAVALTSAAEDAVTLVMPDEMGGISVTYRYDADDQEFSRSIAGAGSRVLFNGVTELSFSYYNRVSGDDLDPATTASILVETKSIQLDAQLQRKVLNLVNSDYVISATFLMRNM